MVRKNYGVAVASIISLFTNVCVKMVLAALQRRIEKERLMPTGVVGRGVSSLANSICYRRSLERMEGG